MWPYTNLMTRAITQIMAVALASSALSEVGACDPPDCDRPDMGTCVNACCKLRFDFDSISAKPLVSLIADTIAKGGPDGRYYSVENNTVQPWSSDTDFVVQAIHETTKRQFNDTMHLAVQQKGEGSVLFAFSHSQDFIKANFAFGDHGQNYKNLALLVKSLPHKYVETSLFGCPVSRATVEVV